MARRRPRRSASTRTTDADETQNIDVIAGLIYDGIMQLLIRTVSASLISSDSMTRSRRVAAISTNSD